MSHAYPHQQAHPPPASPGLAQQVPRRLPVQPPGITTTLTAAQRFGPRLAAQTPHSPRPGATPISPFTYSPNSSGYSPSVASPIASAGTSMASGSSYNPQEWARSGSRSAPRAGAPGQGQARRVGGRGEVTGMEAALPSPPPPYSASPQSAHPSSRGLNPSPNAPSFSSSQTTSPTNYVAEYNSPASATASAFPQEPMSSISQISSREPAAIVTNTQQVGNFPPPPPNERDRSASRPRFTLASITGRSRPTSSASPSSAMEALQQQTTAAILQTSLGRSDAAGAEIPPAARRAASTGCIGALSGPPRRQSQTETPVASNEPANYGYTLPPPPPGLPPALRSQSMNRMGDVSASSSVSGGASSTAPTIQRTTIRTNTLGSIPPTPAGWEDDQMFHLSSVHPSASGGRSGTESIPPAADYTQINADATQQYANVSSSNSTESTQRDDSSARGIRQRRSDSRAARAISASREPAAPTASSLGSNSDNMQSAIPSNLVLGSSGGAISRRRHVSKAKISPVMDGSMSPRLQRARMGSESTNQSQPNSGSLPPDTHSARGSAPTTPYPGKAKVELSEPSPKVPSSPSWGKRPASSTSNAHGPADRLRSPLPLLDTGEISSATFGKASLNRYKSFIDQEVNAKTDQERLQLFADFIVTESSLRRDRYARAFENLGGDVIDLTRDLWRSQSTSRKQKTPTPSSGQYSPNRRLSLESRVPEPSSASSISNINSAPYTPKSELASPPQSPVPPVRTEPRASFHPILSPIPSMALSSIADDEGSRGRASSRWWETSTDTQSVGGSGRMTRTKRETKYMGVPREARENMQWTIPEDAPNMPSSSKAYAGLGVNEYPPEKTGWHDVLIASPEPKAYTPSTPNIPRLDVSRLITLPPPYPRHHPALSNSHPDLTQLRATLRSLNDREEINNVRTKYANSPELNKSENDEASTVEARRKKHRQSIQDQVSRGTMSFAEAAQAESDFDASEAQKIREVAQRGFEAFQAQVVSPLHSQYTGKLNQANDAIDQLCDSLSSEARSNDPNQIQEEGDEQPELLEKLTLLKWLHEAREQIYKDQFNLEGESNDKYRVIVLLPYRQTRNAEKMRVIDSFFGKDAKDRNVDYDRRASNRFKELLRVMEKHTTRGVEVQLSAFWDIAPELLTVVQKVPSNLNGFDVLIPQHEHDENPSYQDYPLQYLYSLLLHAEKSTYQFIESQTNLLCLLHEAKTSVMLAECRLKETERFTAGEDPKEVEQLTQRIRRDEDASLTADLKERVNLIEDQWREALGTGLKGCQKRIKEHLEELGGFDESLMD